MKKTLSTLTILFFVVGLYAQRPLDSNLADANNYKMAEPAGTGPAHFIERGRDITYTIFFQNNGPDTVLNLRVIDTLSSHLDISTLRQEGASHAYLMTVLEDNAVRFSFANIRLPNSATNESASKGFVVFTVSQKANLPLMTFISNTASIQFDFAPPIFTNAVFHTVAEGFTATDRVNWTGLSASVYPNPMMEKAVFDLQGVSFNKGELLVFAPTGHLLQRLGFTKQQFDFSPSRLPSGSYFYKITLDNMPAASGKLSVR